MAASLGFSYETGFQLSKNIGLARVCRKIDQRKRDCYVKEVPAYGDGSVIELDVKWHIRFSEIREC